MIKNSLYWAWFYRKDRLMVSINTNNGVERQNETFKHTYLNKHHGCSLTGMLSILIEDYFPESFERYVLFISPFVSCKNGKYPGKEMYLSH